MFRKLLIANRGEIALRIARTASELGIRVVTVHSLDDAAFARSALATVIHPLPGRGPQAYLDIAAIIAAAAAHGCDALHPGYGFLSENPALARACVEAGLAFVGPPAEQLELLGDKTRALALARECGIPVVAGTPGAITLAEAEAFLAAQGKILLKAVAGGGGRGIRAVERLEDLADAYARCQSEALRAFGSDGVYAERLVARARHIEVQIIGDGTEVAHLGERECTLQRNYQKLVELAPAPGLDPELRARLLDAACRMATASGYRGIGTFEFLVDRDTGDFFFIEANPRLQVEHTVTEEVMGCDLVGIQLALAAGATLADLGLTQAAIGLPRGSAVQLRINSETMTADGLPRPSLGKITAFDLPGGPGVRVDGFGELGYEPVASFDTLLAKLVISSPLGNAATIARARRALDEFRIDGLDTNLPFLRALLARPEIVSNDLTTRFVADKMGEILAAVPDQHRPDATVFDLTGDDDGTIAVRAPMTGVVSSLAVSEGDEVGPGAELAVLEAMKMEHALSAPSGGIVRAILQPVGSQVGEGVPILVIEPRDIGRTSQETSASLDLDAIRDDLAEVLERQSRTLDKGRPAAVERRRDRGQRTARENIADLLDEDSFAEYGQLAVSYRHSRYSDDELLENSPADGFVAGIGTVNAERHGAKAASVAVGAYDGTVLAGTVGHMNHKKADRLFDLAAERRIPLVLFAEGGGGRPREDPVTITGLNSPSFFKMAKLSGKVPLVAIVSGRCFAANAALAGLADVIIAARDSTIGMAGPALIEAAGLGSFSPEQIGPIAVQVQSGVVDIAVADEAEAVATAKRYLSYFQGPEAPWEEHDPRLLRAAIPENRLRSYDVREVGQLIVDVGSWLELRAEFGKAYVTALARVGGRPIGVIANNPSFNAGAIDSPASDKAARFLRLCNAFGLPVLSLIDTPGIMVGPEAEATGLVRHSSRLFAAGAALEVPLFAIVLRKAYGLGGAAAAGGYFQAPFFTVAWPTGELGGMGLEGSVRLGYRRELEAIADPAERQAFFEKRVAKRYEKGKASFVASYFEIDAVIDPAETRIWLRRGLDATDARAREDRPRFIDTW